MNSQKVIISALTISLVCPADFALRSSESASCFLKAAMSTVVAGLLMASPICIWWVDGD
jgi:hypothetical protein